MGILYVHTSYSYAVEMMNSVSVMAVFYVEAGVEYVLCCLLVRLSPPHRGPPTTPHTPEVSPNQCGPTDG